MRADTGRTSPAVCPGHLGGRADNRVIAPPKGGLPVVRPPMASRIEGLDPSSPTLSPLVFVNSLATAERGGESVAWFRRPGCGPVGLPPTGPAYRLRWRTRGHGGGIKTSPMSMKGACWAQTQQGQSRSPGPHPVDNPVLGAARTSVAATEPLGRRVPLPPLASGGTRTPSFHASRNFSIRPSEGLGAR